MSKREFRRLTAEQKIEILREADQPAGRDSERGMPAPRLGAVGAVSLAGGGPGRLGGGAEARCAARKPRKDDAETRHKAEIERMRAVIAEKGTTAPKVS